MNSRDEILAYLPRRRNRGLCTDEFSGRNCSARKPSGAGRSVGLPRLTRRDPTASACGRPMSPSAADPCAAFSQPQARVLPSRRGAGWRRSPSRDESARTLQGVRADGDVAGRRLCGSLRPHGIRSTLRFDQMYSNSSRKATNQSSFSSRTTTGRSLPCAANIKLTWTTEVAGKCPRLAMI